LSYRIAMAPKRIHKHYIV